MTVYYGTFGCGQTFPDQVVRIIAPDRETAREAMFRTFGKNWCAVYDEAHQNSEFFRTPIMTLHASRLDEYDDTPTVRCVTMHDLGTLRKASQALLEAIEDGSPITTESKEFVELMEAWKATDPMTVKHTYTLTAPWPFESAFCA